MGIAGSVVATASRACHRAARSAAGAAFRRPMSGL